MHHKLYFQMIWFMIQHLKCQLEFRLQPLVQTRLVLSPLFRDHLTTFNTSLGSVSHLVSSLWCSADSLHTFPQSSLNIVAMKGLFMASLAVRVLAIPPLRYHRSKLNSLRAWQLRKCVFISLSSATLSLWSPSTTNMALNLRHLPVMKTSKWDQMMSFNSNELSVLCSKSWL